MSGYESVMLICAVLTVIVGIASFVLDIFRDLRKKDDKSE